MMLNDNIKDTYQSVVDALKKEHDELSLKMHLAGMEVREEWNEVEKKFEHMQSKAHQLNKATGESAHELAEVFSKLAAELKKSYKRLKRTL